MCVRPLWTATPSPPWTCAQRSARRVSASTVDIAQTFYPGSELLYLPLDLLRHAELAIGRAGELEHVRRADFELATVLLDPSFQQVHSRIEIRLDGVLIAKIELITHNETDLCVPSNVNADVQSLKASSRVKRSNGAEK